MTVAKGHIWSDKTYHYRCGRCNGVGTLASGRVCDHCYGLDLDRLRLEFQTAVGERYYAILKAILSLIGRDIYDEARRITELNSHRVTPAVIGYLVERFQFGGRMKPLVEWLEETHFVPAGTYIKLRDHSVTLKEMKRGAWESFAPELEQAGLTPPERKTDNGASGSGE